MDFYQTVSELYHGVRAPTHTDMRILKNGITQTTDVENVLEAIARQANIAPIKAEVALYSAIIRASPYGCAPKTQTSASKWLELRPSSPLAENWSSLTKYTSEKSCCGGCPLVKK